MREIISLFQLELEGGIALIVTSGTEILKRIIPIDARLIAVMLALICNFAYQLTLFSNYGFDFVFAVLNAFISTLAAIGLYETVVKPAKDILDHVNKKEE